jgi:DNA-binding beta-propeller fold protein YncE
MSATSSHMMRRLTAVSAALLLLSLTVAGAAADSRPTVRTVGFTGAAYVSGTFGSALRSTVPASLPGSVAVDTRTNTIYVADGFDPDSPPDGGHTVTVIDGRRCQAANVSRCAGPWPTVSVGNLPSTVAVDEATNTVYVTNFGDGTVSVINGATCDAEVHSGCGQIPPVVTVGTPGTVGIFADDAHHTVYAGNVNTSELAMIDTSNCNAANLRGCAGLQPPTVTVGAGPGDVDVNTRTHTAYVAVLIGVAAFDTDTCNASTQSGCGHVGTVAIPNLPDCGDCLLFSAKSGRGK